MKQITNAKILEHFRSIHDIGQGSIHMQDEYIVQYKEDDKVNRYHIYDTRKNHPVYIIAGDIINCNIDDDGEVTDIVVVTGRD